MIVTGNDAFIAEWVRYRAPYSERGWEKFSAIGIVDNGKLIAGVVYHEYHGHCISASIASESPRWCTRRNLRVLFSYPFIQLGVKRAEVITGASNLKSQNMLERMGFTAEGRLRNRFPNEDAIVYGMLSNECKWIR